MKTHTSLIYLFTLASAVAGGDYSPYSSSSISYRGWSFSSVSVGGAWRSAGTLNYKGSSRSGNALIPSQVGGDALSVPDIGVVDEFGNRTYSNGFVNQDASSEANGDTWFWGYQSDGQIQGDELVFNATGSRSAYSESRNDSGRKTGDDRLTGLSPQIDFLLRPPSDLNLPFEGVLVSFWYFGDDSSRNYSNFSARQSREDFETTFNDRYDISAIAPLIGAPYAGSFEGPGPLISNFPIDRQNSESLIGSEEALFSNSISTSLDLDGYSLAIGPTLSGNLRDDWSWRASGGVTLNVYKWSAKETETLNLALNGAPPTTFKSWQNSKSETDFRLGLYAKGELVRSLANGWFAKTYLQVEVAQSIEMKIGNSEYEFEPGGYALGLSLGRNF